MAKYQNTSKSNAVRHGNTAPRRLHSKKEEQEFGLADKEFELCPDCNSIFFDKAWHHLFEEDAKHTKEEKKIRFKTCPACQMKKDKIFEGELIIKLESDNTQLKAEVLNIIENSDRQAREKDPMDRILWTEKQDDSLHIFTSENQLAVKIGKKLESSLKGGALEIKHSHEEDVTRVRWTY